MPITIYNNSDALNGIGDYNMTQGVGWSYRFYTGSILIPFGFGLSYTTFQYQNLGLMTLRSAGARIYYGLIGLSSTQIGPCDVLQVTGSVTNTVRLRT